MTDKPEITNSTDSEQPEISIDVEYYDDDGTRLFTNVWCEGAKTRGHIDHDDSSVYVENIETGDKFHFESLQDIKQLRAILDALINENPAFE